MFHVTTPVTKTPSSPEKPIAENVNFSPAGIVRAPAYVPGAMSTTPPEASAFTACCSVVYGAACEPFEAPPGKAPST